MSKSRLKVSSSSEEKRCAVKTLREAETSTGIALAGLEEEEGNSGEVVATGPGRRLYNGDLVPCETKPGDSVMYTSRMGQEATLEGKRFIIVSEQDCLCKW